MRTTATFVSSFWLEGVEIRADMSPGGSGSGRATKGRRRAGERRERKEEARAGGGLEPI